MNSMKIQEQIAFLRKQNAMTQEELAKALGVTNQAVSKWESGQCCPDIGLLPNLAMERFSELRVLKTMYALHELTIRDFDLFVSLEEIAAKATLLPEETKQALEKLPLTKKEEKGELRYRLEDSFCHMPALLTFLYQFR